MEGLERIDNLLHPIRRVYAETPEVLCFVDVVYLFRMLCRISEGTANMVEMIQKN